MIKARHTAYNPPRLSRLARVTHPLQLVPSPFSLRGGLGAVTPIMNPQPSPLPRADKIENCILLDKFKRANN